MTSYCQAVEGPTKTVVARPRLPVTMAAAPKPPKVVPQCEGPTCVARNAILGPTARRSCAAAAMNEGTLPMSTPEEAVLVVMGEVGARVDVSEHGTAQVSAF